MTLEKVEAGRAAIDAAAILIKAIGGGVIAVLVAWTAILVANYWRIQSYNRRHGITGLGAVAGGWSFLLQLPIVVILLSGAFGVGFYVAVRLAAARLAVR